MDNQNWDLDFIYNGPLQSRVSCHSGDQGTRALCNLMGDQPLFYIDDGAESDFSLDEMFAEDGEFLSDEALIESLRSRVDAYDRTARALEKMVPVSTTDVFDESFLQNPSEPLTTDAILAFGCQSQTFKDYFDFICAFDVDVQMDAHVVSSDYQRETHTIRVNPFLSMDRAILAVMSAMRTAWHHKQGTLINPLRFQPEDAVLVNRLMAADNKIIGVELAWELRLSGHKTLWDSMMMGSDYDLCAAYAMEAMTNFRSIKNGLALRATFEKWFISGRCKSLDRGIIQVMLGNKTDFIFDDEDTSRTIATDLVARLGDRPMGKNYLTPIVTQIMVDGLYTEVRDRSNANFLWFITFEKRMGNAEQELQQSLENADRLIPTGFETDKGSSHESTADVIAFPASITPRSSTDSGSDENGGSLFYLDHFRALQ